MHLRRRELLADRRVSANVGEQDRERHDGTALGRVFDAAGADLRVLARGGIADPPDGSRIGAAKGGIAELAAPGARQEPEQPPTSAKGEFECVLSSADPRPALAHRWD